MERSIMTMLAGTADGAMLADEQGKVILWNKAAARLLGFHVSEVLGRPGHEVMRGETTGGHPFCSPSCAVGHDAAGHGNRHRVRAGQRDGRPAVEGGDHHQRPAARV